jgi:hypothetical protein
MARRTEQHGVAERPPAGRVRRRIVYAKIGLYFYDPTGKELATLPP